MMADGATNDKGAIRAVNDSDSVFSVENKAPQPFSFDRVFDWRSSERDIYEATQYNITNLAQGYSSCVFAYGQTGSGKTHTMNHLNERLLTELFRLKVVEGQRAESDFVVSVATLEIYNEKIRDLNAKPGAAPVTITGHKGSNEASHGKSSGTELNEGDNKLSSLRGLNWVPIQTFDEAAAVMKKTSANRSVASTNIHEHSSRSHAIMIINLKVRHAGSSFSNASLFLIDLAGSERVNKSMVKGDQLKEAVAINKSLSALGNVLQAIDKKSTHIPYRNSKLTFLLKDVLSGNCRATMIATVGPEHVYAQETLCTLNFASRVRTLKLGRVKKMLQSE